MEELEGAGALSGDALEQAEWGERRDLGGIRHAPEIETLRVRRELTLRDELA